MRACPAVRQGRVCPLLRLQECGLKGYTVGGARLSEKHGGFVINCGGATASDILAVMEHIEAVIYDTYGVNLEREVQILGEDK